MKLYLFKTFTVMICIIILFYSCSFNQEEKTNLYPVRPVEEQPEEEQPEDSAVKSGGEIVYLNNMEPLSMEYEELLKEYMDRFYNSLTNFEADDPADMFIPAANFQALGNKIIWETTAKIREMQKTNLRIDDYNYELVISRVEQLENGDIKVILRENASFKFAGYDGVVSQQKNLVHGFIITDKHEKPLFKWHLRGDGFDHAVFSNRFDADRYLNASNDLLETLTEKEKSILQSAEKDLLNREAYKGLATTKPLQKDYDNEYNRGAAVAYSYEWAAYRNPDWVSYNTFGGNCVNFTSQCIFAAGIPMDYTGVEQWKWFGAEPDLRQIQEGRSASWSSVSAFSEYLANKDGPGISGTPDYNYFACEPGDLIRLGMEEEFKHIVLIAETVKDAEGNTIDYLVNSNTADLIDFPASAYNYTMQSAIKIHGWNR